MAVGVPTTAATRVGAPSDVHRRSREIASSQLDALLGRYADSQECIAVSFRNMVGPLPAHDLTHSLHPYPARLLRQVPRFFLSCEQLGPPGTTVLDPFCGSGTVLVEAMTRDRPAWGVDANPFARLLSSVKTTPLEREALLAAGRSAIADAKRRRTTRRPDVVNISRWFTPSSVSVLSRFRLALDDNTDADMLRALLVVLSLAADRLSLRDRRIPVPVRRTDADHLAETDETTRSWLQLEQSLNYVAERIDLLNGLTTRMPVTVSGSDARYLNEPLKEGAIQRPTLAITSPPYGAAQKYIRSSSLSIGWLGLADARELSSLERENIGREHMTKADLENPPVVENDRVRAAIEEIRSRDETRATVYANYFADMGSAMASIHQVLSRGGHFVLVAAPNFVAGSLLPTPRLLVELASQYGFTLMLEMQDQIRGRALLTKRSTSSGPPIQSEHILLLRKA